jgi:signal transduction histidine kinase
VGLGLVAKIVDGNYGRIEIESKENEGSTFKIYLK